MSKEHGFAGSNRSQTDIRSRFGASDSPSTKPTEKAENNQDKISERKMPTRKVKICTCAMLATLAVIAIALSVVFVLLRSKSSNKAYSSSSCLDLGSSPICSRANSYPFYGTKTDYVVAKEAIKELGTMPNRNDCIPKQIYLFSRHAARYPDAEKIEEMMEKLPKLKNQILEATPHDSICEKFKMNLRDWKISMKPSDDNSLTDVGKTQSEELGMRLKSKYPTLFGNIYRKGRYVFGYTSRERTKETAQAFAKGVFPQDAPDLDDVSARDDILQFHKECEKVLKQKGWKKDKHAEILKFKNGGIMDRIVKDMSQRLGVSVDFDTLKLMFSICQFEYSIMGESVWCPLFKTGYVKAFEYYDDLDDYYEDGYGRKRNYEQACPVIEDLIHKFGSAVNETESNPTGILMFSHAGAIKKVMSRFGLFKDTQDLTADDFCSAQDRKWRSSLMCPFNANLLFVLSSCSGQYFVEAFLQEKSVVLEGCPSSLCPWSTFQSHYGPFGENCDLDKICTP